MVGHRQEGANPFRIPRDDKREECELLQLRIRKIKTAGLKDPAGFNSGFVAELEQRLAVMQADLEILRAQAKAFKIPPPKKHAPLPGSWAV